MGEEVELDEKYDLYHKDFSSAMQHAYDYAKQKMGITVDPKEIDSKVATGPKKPTEGKTNKYMLKGKGGNLQIQVYNKGGSKPFELNMYKEESINEGTTALPDSMADFRAIVDMMKKPIKAKDAGKLISKYIIDDGMAVGIENIAKKDPNADARSAIMKGFNKLKIRTRGEPSYGAVIKFNNKFEISDKRQKTYLDRPSSQDSNDMKKVTAGEEFIPEQNELISQAAKHITTNTIKGKYYG